MRGSQGKTSDVAISPQAPLAMSRDALSRLEWRTTASRVLSGLWDSDDEADDGAVQIAGAPPVAEEAGDHRGPDGTLKLGPNPADYTTSPEPRVKVETPTKPPAPGGDVQLGDLDPRAAIESLNIGPHLPPPTPSDEGITDAHDSADTPTTPRDGELIDGQPQPVDVRGMDLLELLGPISPEQEREIAERIAENVRDRSLIPPVPCNPMVAIFHNALTREREYAEQDRSSRWITWTVFYEADEIMAAASRLVNEVEGSFYIGITSGPSFRYRGGGTDMGNVVRGHVVTWRYMVVIGMCSGRAVTRLEEELIDWAWSEHGARCANKARGGKGIAVDSDSVTFLYICHTMRGYNACERPAKSQRR